MPYELNGKRVWVAGHNGMVGKAICRRLSTENCELITVARKDVDLERQSEVNDFIATEKPDAIILAAAKVGGILANDLFPADFLYKNLMIQANIVEAAHQNDVQKMLLLGSSCIYPKFAPQPITEGSLLSGPLEPTNEWYAIAKIAGIKLAQAYRKQYGRDYISAMPANLYGPHDNFDLKYSHVVPALIRKAHAAKLLKQSSFEVWGTGTPRREFLFVDDMADACVFLIKNYSGAEHVNIGQGQDITIEELAGIIQNVVGFTGQHLFDHSKPDGTPRKLLDSSKLRSIGWSPKTNLESGLIQTYEWFLHHNDMFPVE